MEFIIGVIIGFIGYFVKKKINRNADRKKQQCMNCSKKYKSKQEWKRDFPSGRLVALGLCESCSSQQAKRDEQIKVSYNTAAAVIDRDDGSKLIMTSIGSGRAIGPDSYKETVSEQACSKCGNPLDNGWCKICRGRTKTRCLDCGKPIKNPYYCERCKVNYCKSCSYPLDLHGWCEICERYAEDKFTAPTSLY